MRPYEHAHSLSANATGSYGGSAGATAEKQSSVYFFKPVEASRASLALRGGVFYTDGRLAVPAWLSVGYFTG